MPAPNYGTGYDRVASSVGEQRPAAVSGLLRQGAFRNGLTPAGGTASVSTNGKFRDPEASGTADDGRSEIRLSGPVPWVALVPTFVQDRHEGKLPKHLAKPDGNRGV